jgi:hypothetical protein
MPRFQAILVLVCRGKSARSVGFAMGGKSGLGLAQLQSMFIGVTQRRDAALQRGGFASSRRIVTSQNERICSYFERCGPAKRRLRLQPSS